jgi:Sulfatase
MPGSSTEAVRPAGAGAARRGSWWQPALTMAAAFVGLSLLWNLPAAFSGFGWPWLGAAALEVTLAFALLALVPPLRAGGPGRLAAGVMALATTLVVGSKIAELALRESLGRPLNPLLDLQLARSLVDLLTETLGGVLGCLGIAGLALLPFLVFAGAWAALRATQRALERRFARHATLAASAVLLGLFAVQHMAPQALGPHRLVSDHASVTLLAQWRRAAAAQASLQSLQGAIARDRFRTMPAERLLARLGGADVLLMFVESYGRSALELPRYASTLVPTLDAFDERLAGHGLLAASGWLTSPTVGGQSWLAHGTFESGLWLPDQAHYEALVHSERLTLTRAFARAGYRTVAIKPAITRPWPEGERLGFAAIYAAADLGYAGKPYNWVTMPDQYTLAGLERAERAKSAQPLFAEVSLISSHAPWTPIAPVLEDWSMIADGSVFSAWADDGDPPEVVWRDSERVREQYARALDYVLRVLASYAANFVDQNTLLILVGDHQPAPLLTGEGAARDVPIHVISGDPELLAPFEAWGFTPGMRPEPGAAASPMDAFRDFFLDAFTAPADAAIAGSSPS